MTQHRTRRSFAHSEVASPRGGKLGKTDTDQRGPRGGGCGLGTADRDPRLQSSGGGGYAEPGTSARPHVSALDSGGLGRPARDFPSYLSEIESGKKRPSLDLLDRYARIFGIPASTFLALEEKARGGLGKKTKRAEQLLKYLELMLAEDAARASPKTPGAQDEGWLG